MVTYFSVLLGRLLTWLPRAAGTLYAGMVITRYRTDRPRRRPGFQLRDRVRSAERFVVWLGVKTLEGFLGLATVLLNRLLEASAQDGEWFLRRSPDVQENIRYRFLV